MQIDGSNNKITSICQEISVAHLISLEKKKIYDINEFDEKQTEHRAIMRAKLENAYANIKETIAISYDKCSSELEEVRIAWDEYRRRVSVLYFCFSLQNLSLFHRLQKRRMKVGFGGHYL